MGVVCLDDELDTGPCGIRSVSWAGAGRGVAIRQEARVQVLKAQLPAVLAPLRPALFMLRSPPPTHTHTDQSIKAGGAWKIGCSVLP